MLHSGRFTTHQCRTQDGSELTSFALETVQNSPVYDSGRIRTHQCRTEEGSEHTSAGLRSGSEQDSSEGLFEHVPISDKEFIEFELQSTGCGFPETEETVSGYESIGHDSVHLEEASEPVAE